MRNCPNCGHEFDDREISPPNCPSCGREFTVSDIGAATIDFGTVQSMDGQADETPPRSAPTVVESRPGSLLQSFDGGSSVVDGTSQTLQSGRWKPSDEELADAASSPDLLKTIDSSFLGPAGSNLMQTLQSSLMSGEVSGVNKTLDSSFLGSAAGQPADKTIDSSFLGSAVAPPPGAKPRDVTEMWDSSHVLSESAMSEISGKADSGRGTVASQAGRSLSESIHSESLEHSLVIQPRTLRPDENGPRFNERIDYSLLKKLGEGGMGIVYAARQQSIRRVVALKMLKKAGEQESFQREKFLAEAVITGDLEHPNIVPIYDLGRDEKGAIFYAMKHVKGTPWDKLISKNSVNENLEVLMKVADAIAFAHSRDVVHRDLKPENVMIGDLGEVLVMDWGLALMIGAPPANVAMGGTPGYMAPEMAMGPINAIGFHSDVYLLGAILYEIVTGLRPHTGKTITRCLMAAAKNEIVPTEKTGELVEIAKKAMASKAQDRYASVRDFQGAVRAYQAHIESIALGSRAQDDLEEARKTDKYETFARALFAYQEAYTLWDGNTKAKAGIVEAALAYAQSAERKADYDLGLSLLNSSEPVHAPVIERLSKGRNERESRKRRLQVARRVGVALVAAIFLIVTVASIIIERSRRDAVRARQFAEVKRVEAEDAKQEADTQRERAVENAAEAKRQEAEAKRQEAVALDQKSLAEKNEAEAVRQKTEAEKQRQLAEEAKKLEEYEGYVAKIGLAAAKIEENAFDHALELIGQCPAPLRHWEWGRLRYLCTRDIKSFDLGEPLETVAISPDGKRLAAAGWGGDIKILSIETGKEVAAIPTGGGYVFALAFSPDGKRIAAGTNAKPDFISIWDAASGQLVHGLKGHTDAVLSLAYSRDGSKLLSGSYDGAARIWDVAAGASKEYRGHDWWVWSVAWSPDEQRFITGSQDGSAIVWSVATGQPSPPFLAHGGPVYSAAFSPRGDYVATASYDKRVLLWRPDDLKSQNIDKLINQALSGTDTVQQTPFTALSGHSAGVRSVRFSSDGKMLVSCGNDNAICVWDVASHQLLKTLRGHASRVSAALFMPGDDHLLSGGYDHYAKLWNISKYEEVRVLGGRVLKGHHDSVLGAAFSPDGRTVVTASRDRSAVAWDVSSGRQLRAYREGHSYLASAARFLADGKRVLTSAVDNTVRIWDMASGTQLVTLEGTGTSAAVALSHDGQWIATGSDDKQVRIWDTSGKILREFGGLKSEVTALAISHDDRYLITGDGTGRVRLLRADTGEQMWEARSHSASITSASFMPNGKRALTASLDNSVAQWDLATGQEDRQHILKHPDPVTALSLSADGTKALTAAGDNIVRLWDLARGEVLVAMPPSAAPTTDVAISPDGARGVSTTSDNRLHLWNLTTGREVPPPGETQGAFLDVAATTTILWSAAFSADGSHLLTVGGAEAQLWNVSDGKQLMSFSPQSAVSSVQFAKGGDKIVTGSWDNAARIWNTASGTALVKLGGVHTRFVNASVFSPDGTQVLTASDDKTARLWDASTGKLIRTFVGHESRVTDVAFSSDGKWALTASDDKTARIWDIDNAKELRVLRGHTQAVLCARFAADNRRVITGSDDNTARLWDATTGESLGITLAGHTAAVTSVAFTPDGERAITGSKDITAKLWDPATGKEILTLTGHTEEITTVAISPDGSSLLTGSRDGTAIVWLTSPWRDVQAPVAQSRLARP
jgi:WD40 repeat protein/serine/threonine protein kinase